jgi:hypothetical protein
MSQHGKNKKSGEDSISETQTPPKKVGLPDYVSLLENGILHGWATLGRTATSTSEATELMAEAAELERSAPRPTIWPDFGMDQQAMAVKREEALGLAMLGVYKKTRDRVRGGWDGDWMPGEKEKVEFRPDLERMAGTLSLAYHSPTCSNEVRKKIGEEAMDERYWQLRVKDRIMQMDGVTDRELASRDFGCYLADACGKPRTWDGVRTVLDPEKVEILKVSEEDAYDWNIAVPPKRCSLLDRAKGAIEAGISALRTGRLPEQTKQPKIVGLSGVRTGPVLNGPGSQGLLEEGKAWFDEDGHLHTFDGRGRDPKFARLLKKGEHRDRYPCIRRLNLGNYQPSAADFTH